MELSCKSYLAGLFLKLLHGAVLQKLSYKGMSQTFAWNCHAEVAFRSFASSFCVNVSCESCLSKLFLKLLYGTVVFFRAVHVDSSFCWKVCRIILGEVLGAVLGAVYFMKPGWDHFCGKGRGLCPRRQFGHSCIKVGHSWLDTLEIKYSSVLVFRVWV